MSVSLPLRITAAALVFILAACNQQKPQTSDSNPSPVAQPSAPAVAAAPSAPLSPAPPPIQAATEQTITSVDSVTLNRPDDTPNGIIIHTSGTVASVGWTDPKLLAVANDSGDAGVATYKFVATSPAGSTANSASQTVEAEIRLAPIPDGVKTIRIVAQTNQVSAPLTQ